MCISDREALKGGLPRGASPSLKIANSSNVVGKEECIVREKSCDDACCRPYDNPSPPRVVSPRVT